MKSNIVKEQTFTTAAQAAASGAEKWTQVSKAAAPLMATWGESIHRELYIIWKRILQPKKKRNKEQILPVGIVSPFLQSVQWWMCLPARPQLICWATELDLFVVFVLLVIPGAVW